MQYIIVGLCVADTVCCFVCMYKRKAAIFCIPQGKDCLLIYLQLIQRYCQKYRNYFQDLLSCCFNTLSMEFISFLRCNPGVYLFLSTVQYIGNTAHPPPPGDINRGLYVGFKKGIDKNNKEEVCERKGEEER
jgi:hypothetical protein